MLHSSVFSIHTSHWNKALIRGIVAALVVCAALVLTLLAAPPKTVHAAAITVNSLADTTTPGDGICTLREAINNANSDSNTAGGDCVTGSGADTITFSVSGTITLGSTLPNITTTMAIDGSGQTVVISGNNTVRVFYVEDAGNLTLDTITVQNGKAGGAGDGGGVENYGTLRVINSTFSGNSASHDGGGIYSFGDAVTVTNSTFSGNSAARDCGGIGTWYLGTVTVTNSTLSGNSSTRLGGGICNNGTLTVTNSTLSGNSAPSGGGIYSDSTVTVTNSTLSGNSASSIGGGIWNNSGTLYLAGTILDTGTSGDNCYGIGVMIDNGYNLSDDGSCGFTGTGSQNNATLNLGALANNGGSTQTHLPDVGSIIVDLIPDGTTISNNGMSYTCNQTGEVLDTDQRGQPRPATAGRRCDAGAVEARDWCPNPANITTEGDLGDCIQWANTTAGPQTLGLGADITLSAELPHIASEITLNGNGRFVSGNNTVRVFYVEDAGNLTLDTITVQNGKAGGAGDGGGVENYGTLRVINSTFSGNSASHDGGGIYSFGDAVTVTNSTFSGNSAARDCGGIGTWYLGTVTVTNSTLSGNSSTRLGGGICNNGTLTVTNSTLSGNSAPSGGGIYSDSTVTVTNSTLSGNSASSIGGGIWNNSGTLYLAGTILDTGTSGDNCYGIGVMIDNGYNLSDDGSCGFTGTGSQNNVTLNLDALADNGGPTQTHLPGLGSAAIDLIPDGTTISNNGVSYTCNQTSEPLDTDQRGQPRPQTAGERCDVGSVEVEAPVLFSPADGTLTNNNRPTFTWNAVSYGVTYQIQINDTPDFSSTVRDETVAGTQYTSTVTLTDWTTYSWRVRAFNVNGVSGPWSTQSFTVDINRLRAPLLALPKDRSNTPDQTPTLSWGAVSGAKLYQVQWSSDPLLAGAHQGQVTTLTYTVPEQPYGVYFWRVRAQDAALRWSDWSLTRTLTITLLSTPTNAQHLTDTTPAFVWKAVTGASEYHLEVYDDEALTNIVFQFTGLGTTTTASTLSEGQHWWRMQVKRAGSYGAWTPVWMFTITPPTTVAPKLTEPVSGSVQITNTPFFSWQSVAGGVRYQIQIDNNDTFASPAQDAETQPAGTLSYTASPMPDGGKFYWRVRAINNAGVAGAWSAARSFTLQQVAVPVLTSPVNPTTTAITTPSFTWNGVLNADSYQIQLSSTSNLAVLAHQGSDITTTGYTVPATLPDGKYFWRVRGVTSTGVAGRWSAAWVISIDTTGPPMPVLLTPTDKAGTTDTTPTFTWNAVTGAKGYQLQLAATPDLTSIPPVAVTGLTYTVPGTSPLAYGVYYWRVQAKDALGNWGAWSPTRSFAVTILKTPKDGATTTDTTPVFTWAAVAGASYVLQVDTSPAFDSDPLPFTYTGTALTATPGVGTPLVPDTYYWRVQVQPAGIWMPAWTLVVSPSKPAQVVLSAPASATLTNDSTPTLSWKPASNANTYQVQIDNNGTFTSPEQDVTVGGVEPTSCIASDLSDGLYSWRVRALNSAGAPGAWSYKRTFTVDTIPLAAPILVAPLDGASSTNTKLTLSWGAVAGVSRYQLQLDPDPAFPLPVVDAGTLTTYKSPTPLSRGIYFWQVRTLDKAGNVSAWSETRSFEILAGVTAPVVEPSTPLPTEPPAPTAEPAIMPTVEPPTEPTVEPTVMPLPALLVIESDDAQVQQAGTWTAHDTALASGGRYLYSSGSAEDSLSLTFEGTRLDVVYVKHPSLGTLIVEADGMPLQAVDSSAADSEFGARVSFTLANGVHTVRLYPLTGTIAIDAFAVETPVETSIIPTVESLPTETPPSTAEPTVELTVEPTVEPPIEPTTEPTATPLPALLPLIDTFDSGTGWQASGAWRFDIQTAYRGGGWFADSSVRGQSSMLTANTALDLRIAQNPELTFWQRAVLSGGDGTTLDLSIDGGLTWMPLDQQSGATFDWSPRTVSLAAYRGVVVTLRFRLDTLGTLAEGETSVGWWIDDLTVQDIPVVPPTPTPLPTEAPTETPLPTVAPTPTELPTETSVPTVAPTDTLVPTTEPPTVPPEPPTPTAEAPGESPQDTGS